MSKVKQLAEDVKRYNELKSIVNPNNYPFIEMEDTPDWKEFNDLSIKLTPYFQLIHETNIFLNSK